MECRSSIDEGNTPTQILSKGESSDSEKDTKQSDEVTNLDHTRKGMRTDESLDKKASENSCGKPIPNQVVDMC